MKTTRLFLVLLFAAILCGLSPNTWAQKKKKDKKGKDYENLELDDAALFSDTIPDLELELPEDELNVRPEEERKKKDKKKKKKKKSVYFGLKTKRGFIRQNTSRTSKISTFRMVDKSLYLEDTYQQEIHYYDLRKRRIRKEDYFTYLKTVKSRKPIMLLHGEYKVYRNRILIADGFYYKGLKHGKWKEYDTKGVLTEKIRYDLGFTQETKVSYYQRGKIKEIIPMVHGRMQGTYYMFYENGVIAFRGNYDNNQKVGIWREWYKTRQRKLYQMYPNKWWDEAEPKKLQEWNAQGRLIYDIDRGGVIKR